MNEEFWYITYCKNLYTHSDDFIMRCIAININIADWLVKSLDEYSVEYKSHLGPYRIFSAIPLTKEQYEKMEEHFKKPHGSHSSLFSVENYEQ